AGGSPTSCSTRSSDTGSPAGLESRRRSSSCSRSSFSSLAPLREPAAINRKYSYPVAVTEGDRSGRTRDWADVVVELLEWPYGIARLAAASCAVIAIAVLLYEVPHVVRTLGSEAHANASLSFADREIAGGNSILVDQIAAYEARGLIPPDAPYRVVTGPNLKKSTPLTLQAVGQWLSYFL